MEVVALNEQLRDAFSPVLKALQSPTPSSTSDTAATAGVAMSDQKQPQSVRHTKATIKSVHAAADNGSAALSPCPTSALASGALAAPSVLSPPQAVAATTSDSVLSVPLESSHPPVRIDRFRQHCLTVVHRLNTYQYASKQAFCQELAQLALVAHAPEQQRALQDLNERVAALESLKHGDADDNDITGDASSSAAQQCGRQVIGALEFDMSASIPGLQEVQSGGATKWLCNVNIQDQSVQIGKYLTRENALRAYELFRFDQSTNRGGAANMYKLAERLAVEQRASDARVLEAAASAIHSRLSWQRLNDMMSLATTTTTTAEKEATPNTSLPAAPSKPTQQQRASVPGKSVSSKSVPNKGVPTKSALAKSATSKGVPASPLLPTATGPTGKSKSAQRKKPAHRLAHLRLRRLVQMKLCPHLRGQEVCVVRRTGDEEEKVNWTPTGRLEAGKVLSYKLDKLVTFADFVTGETKHLVSACPHIFLVTTRESIDSHLKDCDTFSDADRQRLGEDFAGAIQAYMKAPEPRASGGSRRR